MTKTKHLLGQAKIYFSFAVNQEGFFKKHSSLNKTLLLTGSKSFFFFFFKEDKAQKNKTITMESILNIKKIAKINDCFYF